MHPLFQFRTFASLRANGQGDEKIAAAIFVTPQIVKQRLKLASEEAIGSSADVALTLLLSKLMTDRFQSTGAPRGCLGGTRSAQVADLKSPVALAADERHAVWEADLPLGDDAASGTI